MRKFSIKKWQVVLVVTFLILLGISYFLKPQIAYSQTSMELEKSPAIDSLWARDSSSTDVTLQTYKRTEQYDEVIIWAKCDTTALDSIAFYVVLDLSNDDGGSWYAWDSTANATTVSPAIKRITGVGARYLRLRINGGTANSRNPSTPVSVTAIFRKK